MAGPPELVPSSFEMVSVADLTVTSPTGGSRDTVLGIQMAEIWRGCKVEEISGSGGFHLGVPWEQGRSGSYTSQTDLKGRKSTLDGAGCSSRVFQSAASLLYLCGAVKAFLQHNTNPPERRHHLPAGSQLARSRHAMTLALNLHVVEDGLEAQDKWLSG